MVLQIRALVHDLQRGPNPLDRKSYVAKPGTGQLTDLTTADLWASEPADTTAQAFAGWFVELDPV